MNRVHSDDAVLARILLGLLLTATLLPALSLAANDPGHDILYVLKLGSSNVTGSINISQNLSADYLAAATLIYGTMLDIRANGSVYSVSSRPTIQADANDLYLDSIRNVLISTQGGTTGVVQVGPTTGSSITLNVSGTIRQQGVQVCLANGTNCQAIGGASSGGGWTNNSQNTTTTLNVGIGTTNPGSKLEVNGNAFFNGIATAAIFIVNGDGIQVETGFVGPGNNIQNGNLTLAGGNNNNVASGAILMLYGPTHATHANQTVFTGGNVGVNTTLPNYTLHVVGTGSFNGGGLLSNGSQVCTAANGLCNGTATGNVSGTGTTGTLAKWTGGGLIGNSIASESGSTLTINGNISMPTSFWIGNNVVSSNENTVAVGINTQATGNSSNAYGTYAFASGDYSSAFGFWAQASGYASSAYGNGARAFGSYSSAFGVGALANGTQSAAYGESAQALGNDSVAVGIGTQANGSDTIALGNNAKATGSYSAALGVGTYTPYDNSVALGRSATTTAQNQLMVGASGVNLNTYIYGTLNSSGNVYENGSRVCTAANGLCSGGSSAGGWTNTTTTTSTGLNVNVYNGSNSAQSFLYVNQTTGNTRFGAGQMNYAGRVVSNANMFQLAWGNPDGSNTYGWISNNLISGANNNDLALGANDTERIRISAGGNVGIGTTGPGAPLEVYKQGGGADTTGGGLIVSRYNTGTGDYRGGAIYSRALSGFSGYEYGIDALVFGVTTDDGKNPYSDFDQARMVIVANGNVGIGTTNASARLRVAGGNILLDNGQAYAGLSTTNSSVDLIKLAPDNKVYIGDAARNIILNTGDLSGVGIGPNTFFYVSSGNLTISTGNLGINAYDPTANLQLKTTTTTGNGMYIDASTVTTGNALLVAVNGTNMDDSGRAFQITRNGADVFHINEYGQIVTTGFQTSWEDYWDGGAPIFLGGSGENTNIGSWNNKDIVLYPHGTGNVLIRNNSLGIGTTAPTHSLTLASTTNGTAIYNTADQTANYERARAYWEGNYFKILTEKGGSGSARPLWVGAKDPQSMSLITNNAQRVFVDWNGNVGVNTTAPNYTLHVVGSANFVGSLLSNSSQVCTAANGLCASGAYQNSAAGWTNDSTTTRTNLKVLINSSSDGSFIIQNQTGGVQLYVNGTNGYVGIGTTNPTAALVVARDETTNPLLVLANTVGSANDEVKISFRHEVDNEQAYIKTILNSGWPTDMAFGTATGMGTGLGERMRIKSNGNVGIGTTSPAANLELKTTATTGNGMVINGSSLTDGNALLININGSSMNAGWPLRLTNNGTTVFGVTEYGTLSLNGVPTLDGDGTSTYIKSAANGYIYFYPNNTQMHVMTSNGNVGINTTAPNYTLHVVGTANVVGSLLSNGSQVCTAANGLCPAGNVSGAGTSGTLAKFTTGGTIGNSIVSESGNTLTVSGNISMPGSFYIGSSAVSNNTWSVAVGPGAQATGDRSSAFGNGAQASAQWSSAYGTWALANRTSGSAFGNGAQATGDASTAIGPGAHATGTASGAFGDGAQANADFTSAVGYGAQANVGSSNAFGFNALANDTYASAYGTGAQALGISSTAVGRQAVATAYTSSAFGFNATASDSRASAFGSNAQATADRSSAFGSDSLASSPWSSAFGNGAQATGSSGSSAFGYNSLANGSYSTAYGESAHAESYASSAFGPGAHAAANFSTALGAMSNASYDNSVALGRSATTTAANQLMVGASGQNLNTYVYGTLNTSGNVYENGSRVCTAANGLCTTSGGGWTNTSTTTSTGLSVLVNNSNITGSFKVQNTSGSSHLFVNGSSGYVGIGTSAPVWPLHVEGSMTAYAVYTWSGDPVWPRYTFVSDAHSGMFLNTTSVLGFSTNSLERMRIDSSGRVGINTTSPGGMLTVGSGANDMPGGQVQIQPGNSSYANVDIKMYRWDGGSSHFPAYIRLGGGGGDIQFLTGPTAAIGSETVTEKMTILQSGKVGINTTSPNYSLSVVGNIYLANGANSVLLKPNGDGQLALRNGNDTSGAQLAVTDIFSSGKLFVGAREVGPAYDEKDQSLTLAGGYDTYYGAGARIQLYGPAHATNANKTVLTNGGITWTIDQYGNWYSNTGIAIAIDSNIGGNLAFSDSDTLYLTSGTGSGSSYNIILKPSGSGYVGIGTTVPTQKLDVNGSGNISGTNAKLWVNGSQVCTAANGLCASGAYQNSAAGWSNDSTTTRTNLKVLVNSSSDGSFIIQNQTGGVQLYVNGSSGSVDIGTGWNLDQWGNWWSNNGIGISYDSNINTFALTTTGYTYITSGKSSGAKNNIILMPSGSGYVGIGTTAPNKTLHVNGNASIGTPLIYIDATLEATGNSNQFAWGFPGGATYGFINNQLITGGNNYYLALGANETERIRISAEGNVGIGTANPTADLTLVTKATTGNGMYIDASNITTGNGLLLAVNGTNMDGTGRAFKITRDGTDRFSINEWGQITSDAFDTGWDSYWDGGADMILGGGSSANTNTNIGSWNNKDIVLYPRGTGNVIIRNNSLGIGATPNFKLDVRVASQSVDGIHVQGADNHWARLFPSLGAANYNPIVQAGDQGIIFSAGSQNTGAFVIAPWSSSTNGIRMNASGAVGIGTTTPGEMLEVNGKIQLTQISGGGFKMYNDYFNGNAHLYFYGSEDNNYPDFVFQSEQQGTGTKDLMWIDGDNGYVGIGTTTPTQKIDVNGSGNFSGTNAILWVNGSKVCTAANGLCSGGNGSGNISGGGTSGTLAKFTAGSTIGNSIVSESGSTLTINGNISMPSSFWIGSGAVSNNANTVAVGTNSRATGDRSSAFGYTTNATDQYTSAFGAYAQATGYATSAYGFGALANGSGGSAYGQDSRASGTQSSAYGHLAVATGYASSAYGYSANATGSDSAAYGYGATATGDGGVAVGPSANATGYNSVAIGSGPIATNYDAVAIGTNAISQVHAIAIGLNANASEDGAVSIGWGSKAEGSGTAISTGAVATGYESIAIGNAANATNTDAIAIGPGATSIVHAAALGANTNAGGDASVAIGNYAKANGTSATAITERALATGWMSIALGNYANALDDAAIAIGAYANATQNGAIAIGYTTKAGWRSTAVGYYTNATNQWSVALGYYAATTADNQFMVGSSAQNLNTFIYGSLTTNSSASTGSLLVKNTTGSAHLFVNGSSGNVGIGTTAPSQPLSVDDADDNTYISMSSSSSGLGTSGFVAERNVGYGYFRVYNSNADPYVEITTVGKSGYKPELRFAVPDAGEVMRIKTSGNVGIGTTNATQKLDVNGSINVTGTSACVYLPSGGRLCGNSTCSTLYSPNGVGKVEACN